jgi:hypothetical protein
MAGVLKYNGQVESGNFIGYPLLMVKAACTGGFLAASEGSDGEIVENGYDKAVKVFETVGSVLWVSVQDDDSITVMVESSTFPQETADLTALDDALTAVRDGSNALTVTTSSALNGDGTFTYA